MTIEFKTNLQSGQRVFVRAEVRETELEIIHVMTGDDSDATEIPLSILVPSDRFAIEVDAATEYRERMMGDVG